MSSPSDDSDTADASGASRARTDADEYSVDVEESPSGRRELVVPLRLYKTVTVFSTLIAIGSVLGGFMLLDAATLQVSLLRTFIAGALDALGVGLASETLSALLGVVGILLIAFGAFVYVIGTRFRARQMGNAEEDAGEPSDNG